MSKSPCCRVNKLSEGENQGQEARDAAMLAIISHPLHSHHPPAQQDGIPSCATSPSRPRRQLPITNATPAFPQSSEGSHTSHLIELLWVGACSPTKLARHSLRRSLSICLALPCATSTAERRAPSIGIGTGTGRCECKGRVLDLEGGFSLIGGGVRVFGEVLKGGECAELCRWPTGM